MNAEIRIYPDKEMYAVDMAELMHAAIPESGVLQGCALEFNGGNVTIQPGRLVIKGRLAVIVTAGIIEPSELVTTNQTGHICAICNLSDQNEEYVKLQILPDQVYDDMILASQGYESGAHGDTFNAANGVAILELGTITMTSSGLVGPLTLTEAGEKPRNTKSFIEKVRAALQTTITSLSNKVTKLESVALMNSGEGSIYKHFNARAHSSDKFKLWNVTYHNVSIAANSKKTVTFQHSDYGWTWNASTSKWENSYKKVKEKYTQTKDNNYYRTSIKTFDRYGYQFLEPIGIVSVLVTTATSGGKNTEDCAPTAWRFTRPTSTTNGDIKVDIRNFNTKEAAVVNVTVRMLYVQTE